MKIVSDSRMVNALTLTAVICVLCTLLIYFAWQALGTKVDVAVKPDNVIYKDNDDAPPVSPIPAKTSPEKESDDEVIVEVEPPPPPPPPLPSLDESDLDIAVAIKALADVSGLFSFKAFIRHFVVTIDNLTREKIAQRYVFTQRVPDKFVVATQEQDVALLDEKNFQRYAGFVSLADQVNSEILIALYVKFYPLFQTAYEELGYPDQHFNDRLIQVIDHLLDTVEVRGPITLIRPNVFWLFANPELESLSAGQKIFIRMGRDNSRRVKAKLTELRGYLTVIQL